MHNTFAIARSAQGEVREDARIDAGVDVPGKTPRPALAPVRLGDLA
jgi:hypothetical protein